MKISYIDSLRKFQNLPFWQIVFEWENIFSESLDVKIVCRNKFFHFLNEIVPIFNKNDFSLIFDMGTKVRRKIPFLNANSNQIPYIIDFWCKTNEIPDFDRAYKNAPAVFISSRQAFDFLNRNQSSTKIHHLALSLPDSTVNELNSIDVQKQYDIALLGRESRVFKQFFDKYLRINNSIKVIRTILEDGKKYYIDQTGTKIGEVSNRSDYLKMLKMSKVFFYSTPGIDDSKKTNGFSQVTPRFLEAVAANCNIILRYQSNSDTEFYELNKFGNHINTYSEFELAMNKALSNPPNYDFYKKYIRKHSTSQRAFELKEILKKI